MRVSNMSWQNEKRKTRTYYCTHVKIAHLLLYHIPHIYFTAVLSRCRPLYIYKIYDYEVQIISTTVFRSLRSIYTYTESISSKLQSLDKWLNVHTTVPFEVMITLRCNCQVELCCVMHNMKVIYFPFYIDNVLIYWPYCVHSDAGIQDTSVSDFGFCQVQYWRPAVI